MPSQAAPPTCQPSWGPVPRERPILTEELSNKAEGSDSTHPYPALNIQARTQEKFFLKKGVNSEECWDFPGGPGEGTLHFHGRGSGSTPGQGIQVLQATQCSLCRVRFPPSSHTPLCRRRSGHRGLQGPAGTLPPPAADPRGLPTTLQTQRLTRPGLPDQTAPHC